MEDSRHGHSNQILRKNFTITGVVLLLLGFYGLATITSLVRAYMAKPDAQNGGIVIMSRFVHISYLTAIGIAAVAVFLVLVGILVIFVGNRKKRPLSTSMQS